MFAVTPHETDGHCASYGTTNVHQVPVPSGVPGGRPASDCGPRVAVLIPSEKVEPSVPGSLTALPDSSASPVDSHTEIVNERLVLISARDATAYWSGPVIDSA